MSAPDLLAGELTLPGGETVAVPPELAQAIEAAGNETTDATDTPAARTAFGHALIGHLFARDLMLVPRGQIKSRETVNVDIYSMVCGQKHDLQRRLKAIADLLAGDFGKAQGDLLEDFESLIDTLMGRIPTIMPGDDFDRARARINGRVAAVKLRLDEIRRLALGLPPIAPAGAALRAADAGGGR